MEKNINNEAKIKAIHFNHKAKGMADALGLLPEEADYCIDLLSSLTKRRLFGEDNPSMTIQRIHEDSHLSLAGKYYCLAFIERGVKELSHQMEKVLKSMEE